MSKIKVVDVETMDTRLTLLEATVHQISEAQKHVIHALEALNRVFKKIIEEHRGRQDKSP